MALIVPMATHERLASSLSVQQIGASRTLGGAIGRIDVQKLPLAIGP